MEPKLTSQGVISERGRIGANPKTYLAKKEERKMFIFSTVLSAEKESIREYKADAALAFEAYCDTVYRLAFIRTGNNADADDIMSDVFLRLVRNIHKIKSEEHLKAWLIRATINCSNSFFKRQKRINHVRITEVDEGYEMAEDLVLPAVLSLPPHQKTAIYMHYFEGYSVEEIAVLCGIATGTVKSRLARARDTLRNTLKGEILDV